MLSPGANTDRTGPTLENDETTSDLVVEPTLTADETHDGALSCEVAPVLPDAATKAMPTERRLSMKGLAGSSSQLPTNAPRPTLRLTDEKLNWLRRLYT